MKKVISSFTLAALIDLGSYTAFAQEQNPNGDPTAPQPMHRTPDPARQAHHLSKRLNLTADQERQVAAIFADRQQQMASIRGDNTLSPKDRSARLHSVRDENDGKILALLNDTQKQAYEQIKQQAREKMRQRREGSASAPQNSPAANS